MKDRYIKEEVMKKRRENLRKGGMQELPAGSEGVALARKFFKSKS